MSKEFLSCGEVVGGGYLKLTQGNQVIKINSICSLFKLEFGGEIQGTMSPLHFHELPSHKEGLKIIQFRNHGGQVEFVRGRISYTKFACKFLVNWGTNSKKLGVD